MSDSRRNPEADEVSDDDLEAAGAMWERLQQGTHESQRTPLDDEKREVIRAAVAAAGWVLLPTQADPHDIAPVVWGVVSVHRDGEGLGPAPFSLADLVEFLVEVNARR